MRIIKTEVRIVEVRIACVRNRNEDDKGARARSIDLKDAAFCLAKPILSWGRIDFVGNDVTLNVNLEWRRRTTLRNVLTDGLGPSLSAHIFLTCVICCRIAV